jgi:hypothetical protein
LSQGVAAGRDALFAECHERMDAAGAMPFTIVLYDP